MSERQWRNKGESMTETHKYPYKWTLKDAIFTKDKGTVFSCFACGGGSTMGYKLAGFDVIGCNEIDPKMMECYITNHNPKYSYLEPIQTFKDRDDLPNELYNLDILDGSPPCSSFSMAGNREKDWGKKKKFREGQSEQILDNLFFDFIGLAKKLQPKIVIAENVKGLLQGEAKQYLKKIISAFIDAGYRVDYKLLDASRMGVPQRRERVFFYAVRRDIHCDTIDLFGEQPRLSLDFNEKEIIYSDIESPYREEHGSHIPVGIVPYWEKIYPGESCAKVHEKGHFFQELKLHPKRALPTLRAGSNSYYHYKDKRRLFNEEIIKGGAFPIDYKFNKTKPIYVVGMSVPPIMMAQIASRIYEQWLK